MASPEEQRSVAVLSMAGRFPGARNLDEYWQNLRNGVESIHFFTDAELQGTDLALLNDAHFVRARAALQNIELFDAGLFNFTPREAELTDPQQRIFLECVWEALEEAGYDTERFKGWVGVFAGSSTSMYFLQNICSHPEIYRTMGDTELLVGNEKDFLTSRVSYKLDLRGPSVSVNTACSTSLVAVHLACQSLLNYHCDMALAGGVSLSGSSLPGYFFNPDGIISRDGHCRTFDAAASGTVGGEGAGVVLLKRLPEAISDGDRIRAVIRGSAVNCDGAKKVGYTAPSVGGQAEVIALAQAVAGVSPEFIEYLEAHGTATPKGDPVEVAALTRAFRSGTAKNGFCALGSVKTNIGHCGAAAGMAGLIKTILALEHKELPPSLNFETPNPEIDFAHSPFYVNTTLKEWTTKGRRFAGVSSFGIGGTNAHVVVEEGVQVSPSGPSRPWQLLVLSAKTKTALDKASNQLSDYLKTRPKESLADVAYTLQVGRRRFPQRRVVVCKDLAEASELLPRKDDGRVLTGTVRVPAGKVAFLFPGLGDHYPGMAFGLYRQEKIFRNEVDRCAERLRTYVGVDIRELLYPEGQGNGGPLATGPDLHLMLGGSSVGDIAGPLDQTYITHPVVFAVEYALARMWMHWGVQPRAMIGHSLGEYVAACVAGVIDLEEALWVVSERAKLIERLPSGGMLSIFLGAPEVRPLLSRDLWLASSNGPRQCVVAGEREALRTLQEALTERSVASRYLRTSHAFHSGMMTGAASGLEDLMRQVKLRAPKIPYISNVTGTWITDRDVQDPQYWSKHLCEEVKFGEGVRALLTRNEHIFLEVGPAQTLSTVVTQSADRPDQELLLSTLRCSYERQDDELHLIKTLGRLWMADVDILWERYYEGQKRWRTLLPTYPMERRRYWIDANSDGARFGIAHTEPLEGTVDEPRPDLAPPLEAAHGKSLPRNELENSIVQIWRELFGLRDIGIYDNFFELGGHSLLAAQLVIRMQDLVHLEIPLRTVFEKPTVAGLAATVDELVLQQSDRDIVGQLMSDITQLSEEDLNTALTDEKRALQE